MRRLGRTCTFLLYPQEGHEPTRFSEPNRRDVVERVLSFLDEHLAGHKRQPGGTIRLNWESSNRVAKAPSLRGVVVPV